MNFTPELMDALAKALGGHKQRSKKAKGRVKATPEERAARMAANDAECIKVFTDAGYKDIQPRINVLTYGRVKPDGSITGWLAKGRKVKQGEKALQVGAGNNKFNLFHIDQTEVVPNAGSTETVQ